MAILEHRGVTFEYADEVMEHAKEDLGIDGKRFITAAINHVLDQQFTPTSSSAQIFVYKKEDRIIIEAVVK